MNTIRAKQVVRAFGLAVSGVCAVLALGVSQSNAANIQFNFSGSVGDVFGRVFTPGGTGSNGFSSSLPMSGSMTFNSGASDQNTGSNIFGDFVGNGSNSPIQNLTVTVGNYTATFVPGSSSIEVINNHPAFGDSYRISVTGLTGPEINGRLPSGFELELNDPSGNVFSSDHLPTAPPSLSSFASNQWRLIFTGVGHRVQGALTSLVPLPAAVWLFGAGLIALVGLGSRGLATRKES
ncbi:MAG: VPLPA-CTERM sorting domain-containing protein [Nitrospirales bacterium]|nr:VPLPA-CTERM sorting domain-containing protein [Nitrospirales bacterium]QOJ33607.1 MAG: hypothetical protein HRU82_00980 [Nitrospira sp.]